MNKDVYCRASKDDFVLEIVYDDCCESPREWHNLGKMVCFHDRYNLGDKHNYNSPEAFFLDLLSDSEGELLANDEFMSRLYYYWKDDNRRSDTEEGLAIDFLDILEEKDYPYSGYMFPAALLGRLVAEFDWSWADSLLDEMDVSDLWNLVHGLDKHVILPLYLYDHGGITMSTGPFSCRWDSGQVGWIYAEKKKFIEETGYTETELFSTDPHRVPVIGEHVKIEGRDDWGEVTENVIALDGSPGYTVNFDYNKYLRARKPENLVIVPQHEITEVMANRAEQMLINEVETYDLYLTGECYGYRLSELNTCECCGATSTEEIDSCWGFFANDLADLKEQIKNNVPSEFYDLVDMLEHCY